LPPLRKNRRKLKINPPLQKRVKKNGEQREKVDGVIGLRMTPLGVYPQGYRLRLITNNLLENKVLNLRLLGKKPPMNLPLNRQK
jgi:hypothetical protein